MAVHADGESTIIRVLTPAPRSLWSRTLLEDPLSMPDQTPEWTDAVIDASPWSNASRLYQLGDGSCVVLPLLRHRRVPGFLASMPYGWGFGGLVGRRANEPAVVADVLNDLALLGGVRLRLRPNPLAGHVWTRECPPRPHRLVRSRAHVLDLRPGPEVLFGAMKKETRRHIRRCQAGGLEVEVGSRAELIETYKRLREVSLARWAERSHEPLWLAMPRAHWSDPPRRMHALLDHFGDRYRVWVVRLGGEPVAASVVVLGRNAHATRAAMDRERVGSLGVMAYLDWLGIQAACAAGAQWFHLGESGASASLSAYKEGLGAVAHTYDEIRFEPAAWTAVDRGSRRLVKRALGVVE